ncbi:MAG: ATP-binding protein [Candidatus Korobacteraceae bacterium]
MPELFHSLRLRLQVLGTLVFLFLIGSAIAFALLLRHSETQILSQTSSHLNAVASALARDYTGRAQFESSRQEPLALENSESPGSDDVLSLMTTVVLQREIGTEGGFYSRANDKLLGYAFPTHEGPGVKKDMPQKELPTILDLARKAARTKQSQSLIFRGQLDDIVFEASPIVLSNGEIAGSTWLMKRLPGLHSEQNFRTYVGFVVLGLAAGVCVLLAFLIARNLQSGIGDVEGRLLQLERDLTVPPGPSGKLTEIRRILGGVERLGSALRLKIAKEHDLEEKLRHNERLAALGRVAAGVAHELRNPLATIRLRTQLSARNPQEESVQRNSSVILDEIARLDRMVERLLFFARPLKIEPATFDLCEMLRTTIETKVNSVARKDVAIRWQSGERPLMFKADPSGMRQVFDNLISNAVDSVEDSGGGEVVVAAQCAPDGRIRVEVRDTGGGIRQEDLPHIFDPFFTTKQTGTGLGLSICYEIVKAHGGDVEVESEIGKGTRAVVILPAEVRPSVNLQLDSSGRLQA